MVKRQRHCYQVLVRRVLSFWAMLLPLCFDCTQAFCEDDNAIFATTPEYELAVSEPASLAADDVLPAKHVTEDRITDSFQVQPYGSLWAASRYATSRTFPGAFTLWILSPDEQGESAFELDARRTRAGINIFGPELTISRGAFKTGGQIEIDFFGQFLTENAAGTRLRHAYWEAYDEQWRLLLGQTWDVVSPRLPNSVNFSVGWAGGNIGFRRAQIRLEHTRQIFAQSRLQLQTSINQDIISDFGVEPGIRREASTIPVFMLRTAISIPSPATESEIEFGLSGHYGETGFDFLTTGPPPLLLPPQDDARFKTWSANLDYQLPLTSRLMVHGELFHGANLSPFLGGIGQGVCPCLRTPIHSSGGWSELAFRWTSDQSSHFGVGLDDPANGDFLVGRGLNQFIYVNHIAQLNKAVSTGIEFSWWRTTYEGTRVGMIAPALLGPRRSGEAYIGEWMLRYDF